MGALGCCSLVGPFVSPMCPSLEQRNAPFAPLRVTSRIKKKPFFMSLSGSQMLIFSLSYSSPIGMR